MEVHCSFPQVELSIHQAVRANKGGSSQREKEFPGSKGELQEGLSSFRTLPLRPKKSVRIFKKGAWRKWLFARVHHYSTFFYFFKFPSSKFILNMNSKSKFCRCVHLTSQVLAKKYFYHPPFGFKIIYNVTKNFFFINIQIVLSVASLLH